MNIHAEPETIFNDLWFRVRKLVNSGAGQLEWKRFEKDLEPLAAIDRYAGFELRAFMLAALDRIEESQRFFSQAVGGSDSQLGTVVRYIIVLTGTNHTDEVAKVYAEHRGLLRNDLAAIKTVSEMLVASGHVEAAKELCADSSRLGQTVVIDVDSTADQAVSGDVFAKGDMEIISSDSELGADMDRAIEVVRDFAGRKGAPIGRIQQESLPADGGTLVLCTIVIDQPADEVAELEWELFGEPDLLEVPALRAGELVVALSAGR